MVDIARMVRKLVAPLERRVKLMAGRAVVVFVDDTLKAQGLQVTLLVDEVHDGVERFQDYGFSSVPFKGAEALFLAVGGTRSHGIVPVVADRRFRPTGLSEGDVALHTDKGVRVKLDRASDVVEIGDAPSMFVALADYVDDRFNTLQAAHDGHYHATTATVGPSAVVGLISPPDPGHQVGPLDSTAATQVKAK